MNNLVTDSPEVSIILTDFKLLAILITLLLSLVTTLVVMPKIIAISKMKNLTAKANGRTSHVGIIPTLGGIGVFVGFFITANIVAILFANYNQLSNYLIFNILLLLLLIVGIRDDIMTIPPLKKLIFQIIIAFIFTISTRIHIDSFAGLLGLHEMNQFFSITFSIFIVVIIINAYNLIDGIDGLAGSIGVIISAVMAVVFYLNDYLLHSLTAVSLVGALLAFLFYNFSHHKKIFLGDTGSLVVGFALATQIILYLNISSNNLSHEFKNAPLLVLTLLSYPLIDTLRVFIIRIKNGCSPFIADRNHIHHRLIDLGMSHKVATSIIVCYTVFITSLAFILNDVSINIAFLVLALVSIVIIGLPFYIEPKKRYKEGWL